MAEKTLKVGSKEVTFKASAAVPRMYRVRFGRDIFADLDKLTSSVSSNDPEASGLGIDDLEVFENVAYIMAYHADPSIGESVEDWLEHFEMFSIYEVLPEIVSLWSSNLVTMVPAKKKSGRRKES